MRYATPALLVGLLAVLTVQADEPVRKEKAEVIKRIDLKDVGAPGVKGGTVAKPLILKAAGELTMFPKEGADKIVQQVDFAKQQLVLFTWEGSGQDKLDIKLDGEKANEITFVYTPGKTKDLRPHAHLFAVPKEATVKVEVARPK